MPRLSVWMIRTALIYLGVGFFFGGLMLFNKGIPFDALVWRLLPVHIEILLFGWMLQLAMGTAFWITPRFSSPSRYGRVHLAEAAYVLLNAALLMGIIGQWSSNQMLAASGRVGILLAGLCFALYIVPRIKPLGGAQAEKGDL